MAGVAPSGAVVDQSMKLSWVSRQIPSMGVCASRNRARCFRLSMGFTRLPSATWSWWSRVSCSPACQAPNRHLQQTMSNICRPGRKPCMHSQPVPTIVTVALSMRIPTLSTILSRQPLFWSWAGSILAHARHGVPRDTILKNCAPSPGSFPGCRAATSCQAGTA